MGASYENNGPPYSNYKYLLCQYVQLGFTFYIIMSLWVHMFSNVAHFVVLYFFNSFLSPLTYISMQSNVKEYVDCPYNLEDNPSMIEVVPCSPLLVLRHPSTICDNLYLI
jgi:hypothetical protein